MIANSLTEISDCLQHAGVPFLVVGSFAVVAHGCLPFTDRYEINVLLDPEHEAAAATHLKSLGFVRHVDGSWQRSSDEFAVWVRVGSVDFSAMWRRAVHLKLGGDFAVPVCNYDDLVRLKRQSGMSDDLVDLDRLERVRRTRPPYDPWYACTLE